MATLTDDWALVAAAILVCALVATLTWTKRGQGGSADPPTSPHEEGAQVQASSVQSSADKEQQRSRRPGEWLPVEFHYPKVEPCLDDLRGMKPIPYRPFKWGEYFVTMGIRSMLWDEWVELDQEFFQYHAIRERRVRTGRDRLIQTLPATPGLVDSGHAAATELVQELAEYLAVRFPAVYSVVRHDREKDASGWYGQPSIKEVTILPLEKTYKLDEDDPMVIAALLVQEDLAIMIEGSDGKYYLQAGAILIPGMWRLQDKLGMSLEEIHISGTVPQFQSKLQLSMSRFFKRLPVDKPVVRNNYSLQVIAHPEDADPLDPDELAWAKTMKGEEDVEEGEPGFLRPSQGGNGSFDRGVICEAADSDAPMDPATLRLRVERQTMRRLPRTGAIVFTIRVYTTPLEGLVKEPDVPGRLASAIRSWPEDVARYKARAAFEGILGYLDERHAEQIERGLTTNASTP